MAKTPPTLAEVDSLRHLKVVRSDNPIFQAVLNTFVKQTMDLSYLKNEYSEIKRYNEELIEDNHRLNDELTHAHKYARDAEKSNMILKSALKTFLLNLKDQGIVTPKEDGGHDITI